MPHNPGSRPQISAAPAPRVSLSEVFAETPADAAATGFVLAQLRPGAPVLWVQDRRSLAEAGRPYRLPGELVQVDLSHPRDVLIAAEEGLRCAALAAVVVEIWAAPAALDFTATKRLALRAEASGTPCWLIRRAAAPDLSAARDRWRAASLPSAAHPDDPAAPGDPRWRVELFRSRDRRPGVWVASHDRAAHRLDLAAAVPDRAVAEGRGAIGQRAGG